MEGGLYSNCTVSLPEEKEKPGGVWNCAGGRATGADELNSPEAMEWPPRSYACTFCRREFKSAQALGGHMNVHRRDRALLRRQRPEARPPSSLVIPQQPPWEFAARGGVFIVYPIGAGGAVVAPALASTPSYLSSPVNAGVGMGSSEPTLCDNSVSEELDLELRLGR